MNNFCCKASCLSLFAILLVSVNLHGQAVNENITLQINQDSRLMVNAGIDVNLSESGSVTIGESITVKGGTADFAYQWFDEFNNSYDEKTPEVNHSGKYWLSVSDQKNCSALDSLNVWDYGTGLLLVSSEPEEIVVWDRLSRNLQLKLPEAKASLFLSIVSIDGKVIYTYSESGIRNQFEHSIDLASAENGIYILSLHYNNMKSNHKLMLQ